MNKCCYKITSRLFSFCCCCCCIDSVATPPPHLNCLTAPILNVVVPLQTHLDVASLLGAQALGGLRVSRLDLATAAVHEGAWAGPAHCLSPLRYFGKYQSGSNIVLLLPVLRTGTGTVLFQSPTPGDREDEEQDTSTPSPRQHRPSPDEPTRVEPGGSCLRVRASEASPATGAGQG